MSTFGLSGCRVKPRQSGSRRFKHQNSTRRPRERRKSEISDGRRKKKRENLGLRAPPLGTPPFEPRFFWVWVPTLGPHPSPPFRERLLNLTDSPTSTRPTDRQQNREKKPEQSIPKKNQTINSQKPKSLHTTKTLTLAKVGLAKVGFGPRMFLPRCRAILHQSWRS